MSTACARCGRPAVVRRVLPGSDSTESQPVCERCAAAIDGGDQGRPSVSAASLGRAGLGIGTWGGLGCLVIGGAAFFVLYFVGKFFNENWH